MLYIYSRSFIFLGRLFRRSIERMQPEIAHVPMNLHLQQLLISSGDDPSQSIKLKTKFKNFIVIYRLKYNFFRINL